MIANVLQLGEEERVSLGLLSAWENQLKQMMGGNQPGPNTRPTFEFRVANQDCAILVGHSTRRQPWQDQKSTGPFEFVQLCTRANLDVHTSITNLDVHVSIRITDGC